MRFTLIFNLLLGYNFIIINFIIIYSVSKTLFFCRWLQFSPLSSSGILTICIVFIQFVDDVSTVLLKAVFFRSLMLF